MQKIAQYFLLVLLIYLPCQVKAAAHYDRELVDLLKKHKICLILMRHGEATHNLAHLMTSSKSPGVFLTKKGIQQVKNAAKELRDECIAAIYVSSCFRTLQTAQLLAERLKVPYQKIFVEEALREQYFGDLENHSYEEYESHFKSHDALFEERVPGAESGREVFLRTLQFLQKLADDHKSETLLVVTHGYNSCHIHKCLTGSFKGGLMPAEYRVYDFR